MRTSLCAFLSILSTACLAIDFSGINTSYWYDPGAEVRLSWQVAQADNQIHVFLRIRSQNHPDGRFNVYVQDGYEDADHQEFLDFASDTLSKGQDEMVVQLRFQETREHLLVVRYRLEPLDYYFPIEMRRGNLPFPPFYLTNQQDLPIFGGYVDPSATFATTDNTDELFLYQYREDFPPADPPMGVAQPVSPLLKVDTILARKRPLQLSEGYFYFIQSDTLSDQGRAIYCGPAYFPELRRLEDLVPPMTYITRQSEMTRLKTAGNPKKAFDNFWLTTFSSPNLARAGIRNYFRKIAFANEQFTDYKQGWKTDRGIIYVMYGVPNEVYRDSNSETWRYDNEISFEFRVLSNLFSPQLYVLKRDPEYREGWISRVRIIRGGGGGG